MSIRAFGGISQSMAQHIYSKTKTGTNGEQFVIDYAQRGAQIQKIKEQYAKGEISEAQFLSMLRALQNAPQVVHIDKGSPVVEKSPLKEDTESIFKKEEANNQKTINKLQSDYHSGGISEFEYKANMYLLNNANVPMPDGNNHSLDIKA